MEILNQIWTAIAPYLAGISVSGILSAIIYGCLRGAFNKTIAKIDVEKISENATEKGIEKIKKVSFTHSIQPLVESELKKINETSNAYIKEQLNKVQCQYDKIVNVLEGLASYFDNSIGVSDEAKEKLKEALKEAKTEPTDVESVIVEETTEQVEEEPKETSKKPKSTRVER